MEITINPPKEVVVMAETKKTVEKITVNLIIDNPKAKIVSAQTQQLGRIVLWKDAEYDAIGQWTDSDVQARIAQLYS